MVIFKSYLIETWTDTVGLLNTTSVTTPIRPSLSSESRNKPSNDDGFNFAIAPNQSWSEVQFLGVVETYALLIHKVVLIKTL